MTINTGDNPPLQRGVLQESMYSLVKQGCKVHKELKDSRDLYGYVMISPDYQMFFMAAKGSKLYKPMHDPDFKGKEIASVQRQLLTIANIENSPMILAWWPNSEWLSPRLFLYHPEEILTRWREKINYRFSVVMQNFEFWVGREVYNIERLQEWWDEGKEKWKKKKELIKSQKNITEFLNL